MKRVVFCLFLACLTSTIPASAADWWDAMEAWSGPGPYGHRFGNYLMNVCPNHSQNGGFRLAREASPEQWKIPCVYLNFAGYRVKADVKGYDDVDLRSYDFGVMFELRRAVDIGMGIGWFNTESNGVSSRKLALTPIRVAIRPLCFAVNCDGGNKAANHWARVWTIYLREFVLPQRTRSQDFGAPDVNYEVDYDLLTSAGLLVIDVGELVAALNSMRR